MITKKDWETALEQYKALLINTTINKEAHEHMVKICESNIANFPDDDPMPEDIKEVIKEVKK